ncbi:MAG: glutamate racemase [Spirochaetes bacterium]|nr:glutamate racemase [Spirochaetota bacterium]
MDNRPIGVFDSGIGGLTVLKELKKYLPYEDFIYLGDTARVPYGQKSKKIVTKYARQIIDFLLTKNVKLVVAACNTVSSNSLDILKRTYSIPIIGVMEPGVDLAILSTRNHRVGVIGTRATISSKAYKKLLLRKNKGLRIMDMACPLFVPLVEEGWFNNDISLEVARKYLAHFKKNNIDTLILGCTHYPMLIPVLKKVLKNTVLINSGVAVSKKVKNILNLKKIQAGTGREGNQFYFFTDLTPLVKTLGEKILKKEIKIIKEVSLK